jgi:hypothetical protein
MLGVGRCRDLDACLGFRFGEDIYGVRLSGNGLSVAQGDPPARLPGAPTALGAAVHGQASLARLEAKCVLEISGGRGLAERFMTLFPLPGRFDP